MIGSVLRIAASACGFCVGVAAPPVSSERRSGRARSKTPRGQPRSGGLSAVVSYRARARRPRSTGAVQFCKGTRHLECEACPVKLALMSRVVRYQGARRPRSPTRAIEMSNAFGDRLSCIWGHRHDVVWSLVRRAGTSFRETSHWLRFGYGQRQGGVTLTAGTPWACPRPPSFRRR
jgi:hypothetical protein